MCKVLLIGSIQIALVGIGRIVGNLQLAEDVTIFVDENDQFIRETNVPFARAFVGRPFNPKFGPSQSQSGLRFRARKRWPPLFNDVVGAAKQRKVAL